MSFFNAGNSSSHKNIKNKDKSEGLSWQIAPLGRKAEYTGLLFGWSVGPSVGLSIGHIWLYWHCCCCHSAWLVFHIATLAHPHSTGIIKCTDLLQNG